MARRKNQRRGVYFWRYDQFPYLLWGEGHMREDGRVEIKSYGPGYSFKPILWFSSKRAAQQLIDRLTELETVRTAAMKVLQTGAEQQRKQAIDELVTEQNAIYDPSAPAS